jgi:hypothetical protein
LDRGSILLKSKKACPDSDQNLEIRSDLPYISFASRRGYRPTNLPSLGKVVSPDGGCGRPATKGVLLMITRRKCLIGISATMVSAPAIVRAGSLMKIRSIVMPLQKNYYGFVDRLYIDHRYHTGELRGPTLIRLIEEGVLRVPPATLAYDLARWGTGELSLAARKQRRETLWPPSKTFPP